MSAIIALSIDKDVYSAGKSIEGTDKKFADDLFWLTFYHQHIAQEYGGLATLSNNEKDPILVRTHRGLFRPQFEEDLGGFRGPLGIGHISGGIREPYRVKKSAFPDFAICFAGNIINKEELMNDFIRKGHIFERADDIIIISKLIAEAGWDDKKSADKNFFNGINSMVSKIEGSFALAVLTEKKIYVVRGPDGHETLALAKRKGAVVVVSESNSLYNQKFQYERDLEPGEMLSLDNGLPEKIGIITSSKIKNPQPCSFKWVYTSNPASEIKNLTAAEARRRLGAKLAQRDIENGFIPDVVIPVPDSGRFHAIGYVNEYIRQVNEGKIDKIPYYDESLTKYSYSGRSYTPAEERARNIEALKKIIPIIEPRYKGRSVVVVDDSIVRGTQTTNDLVPKLQAIGFAEIHLRIANPKLVSTCPWGKANKEKKKLAALKDEANGIRSDEEIAERLGVKSCRFNIVDDIPQILEISPDALCFDCDKI